MNVQEGEIVALLGRNGVGRSTTCKAIMGELTPKGSVRFRGQEIAGKKAYRDRQPRHRLRAREPGHLSRSDDAPEPDAGLEAGPEGRRGTLVDAGDVRHVRKPGMRADVEASVLSGGEQQMLTMCRTLMGDPDFVMIDEPTEGLSPQMVQKVAEVLKEIASAGHLDAAGGTKAVDCDGHCAPRLCHGPWPGRVRGHTGRIEGE